MNQHRVVLILILLLAVSIASCKSGALSLKTKKQRAREAIEAVEVSCQRAEEQGGIDVAYARQTGARMAVEDLDYEDQPPYRDRLNQAWESCAHYKRYQIVKHILEPKGHPLTQQEINHLTLQETDRLLAALDFLKQRTKRRDLADLYPYPDD